MDTKRQATNDAKSTSGRYIYIYSTRANAKLNYIIAVRNCRYGFDDFPYVVKVVCFFDPGFVI